MFVDLEKQYSEKNPDHQILILIIYFLWIKCQEVEQVEIESTTRCLQSNIVSLETYRPMYDISINM